MSLRNVSLLVCLPFFCAAQERSDSFPLNLKGRVKHLNECTYMLMMQKDTICRQFIFDSTYKLVDRRYRGVHQQWEYDSKDNLLKESYAYHSEGGDSYEWCAYYKYNNDNKKIEEWRTYPTLTKTIYTYDKKGALIKKGKYNVKGCQPDCAERSLVCNLPAGKPLITTISECSVFHYDSSRNRVKETQYNGSSVKANIYKSIIFVYDSSMNVIEQEEHFANNPEYLKLVSKYDTLGNKIEQYKYYEPSHTFPNDGHVVFGYNENKELTRINTYKENGSLIGTTEFRFEEIDKSGNWLKETILNDGRISAIIKREIEYY